MNRRLLTIVLALSAPAISAGKESISFSKVIGPIIQQQCLSCHSGSNPKGDLDLSDRSKLLVGGASGRVVVPGRAEESLLIQLVTDKKMPPKRPLDVAAMTLLRDWINQGANWDGPPLQADRAGPDFWSLRPIRRPPVPSPVDPSWADNPIDRFIQAGHASRGLAANAEVDRRTYIRRVSLDLTGLRPTPEEVRDFEQDRSSLARERLVDRLLASPAYGERWARHWLDVVRFAESHGYEMNTLRTNAWPYRDWVIRSFNRDLPFRSFVLEQIAADTIPDADRLTQTATGFLVAGTHDLVGNATEEGKRQQRSDDLFDMVATTSASFLGLTAGCARCHDHKFDPIRQRDYYALEAMFAGVEHAERPFPTGDPGEREEQLKVARKRLVALERLLDESEPLATPDPAKKGTRAAVNPRRNVERFPPREVRFIRMTISATNDGTQPCLDELEAYDPRNPEVNQANMSRGARATASSEYPNAAIHKIAHLNDGQHGNSRSWISNEPGKGWAQIELASPVRIGMLIWGRDRQGKFRDRLAKDYRVEVSRDGTSWETVAGSWDRGSNDERSPRIRQLAGERDALINRIGELEKPPTVYAGRFRKPSPTYFLRRGDVMQPGDPVSPGTIPGLGNPVHLTAATSDPDRRRALAEWISGPGNPLPARVMMNRVWHYHFGHGLVRTPSDFGFNGDRPSHPELLDWLAAEYQHNGGLLKPIHRAIVLSRTYRQSSTVHADKQKLDPDNRLLWRFPSRRMEAEAVRDNILQTAGSLNRRAGGPGYHLWTYSNYVTVFTPKTTFGTDEFRRMVYQFKPRTQQDGTFGLFDCPDATAVVPRRSTSTTALQALALLNDPFIHDQALRFANRVKTETATDRDQVKRAFWLAFQRPPTEREFAAGMQLIQKAGLVDLCRMLVNTNEFITLE